MLRDVTVISVLAVLFLPEALSQGVLSRFGLVVEARNITLPAGARAVLSCRSPRLVWTRDNLRDRQRVVHWDLVRRSPEYSVERVLDMSPGARQRVYNSFNKDRVSIPETAFNDGNFSLIINNVVATDKGVYTCNLHHHYCQVHRNIQIQLNVTKSARKEQRYWDGEKTVFVVLLGSSVVLPCVNRRPLWREGAQESQQQVVHWDYQAPGVRPDRAERLVDLYASGERRDYGPLFSQNKMSLDEDAFTLGDFSLSISDLKTADIGLYSCHLHHHYCGIQERRIFRLTVGAPPPSNPATSAPTTVQSNELPEPRIENNDVSRVENNDVSRVENSDVSRVENNDVSRIVNVILPEQKSHVVQHLGYVMASFLLLALISVSVILLTRRRNKRVVEFDVYRYERSNVTNTTDVSLDRTELSACDHEPSNSEYKNNLLKERGMTKDCNRDSEAKLWK